MSRDTVGAYAATVVVQDHDDAPAAVAEIVQRLVREPPGERTVADHRDDVRVGVGGHGVARDRETERVAERGGRVAVLHQVVLRLGTRRVAGQSARLPEPREGVAPTGHELVDVGLVAGVPHE